MYFFTSFLSPSKSVHPLPNCEMRCSQRSARLQYLQHNPLQQASDDRLLLVYPKILPFSPLHPYSTHRIARDRKSPQVTLWHHSWVGEEAAVIFCELLRIRTPTSHNNHCNHISTLQQHISQWYWWGLLLMEFNTRRSRRQILKPGLGPCQLDESLDLKPKDPAHFVKWRHSKTITKWLYPAPVSVKLRQLFCTVP